MSSPIDPQSAREFAVNVVAALREAGHEAYWAGGCVRDQLLGLEPKDYDVATDAEPEQIRELFGRRRTLPIGAAFGVVTVLGPRRAGQIEVATFRRDGGYSDGRHPDSVSFSTAEEDAQRRDFTINGLFYDPQQSETIDFVGGRDDLRDQIIRCIGEADQRFNEDKLRMLRAVRFATTLGFRLQAETFASIRQHAHEIRCVSPERIAAEMRRLLTHADRRLGVELIRDSQLADTVLPEVVDPADGAVPDWSTTRAILEQLNTESFATALAACLWSYAQRHSPTSVAATVATRWRLANDEHKQMAWLLNHEQQVRQANQIPWPQLQRILIQPWVDELMKLSYAVGLAVDGQTTGVDHAQQQLQLPPQQLNPKPLIDGHDLQRLGIPRGPQYRIILEQVRDAQLESKITHPDEALERARIAWQEYRTSEGSS